MGLYLERIDDVVSRKELLALDLAALGCCSTGSNPDFVKCKSTVWVIHFAEQRATIQKLQNLSIALPSS